MLLSQRRDYQKTATKGYMQAAQKQSAREKSRQKK
jgi:hypothetical protein